MRILTESDVRSVMDMAACIPINRLAFEAVARGRANVPVKDIIPIEGFDEAVSLFMPGYVPDHRALGTKVVSVFPDNRDKGLATTLGAMMLFDVKTGVPIALMDATWLTSLRTGAGTGVATDLLARPDSGTLTLIGAGGMGYHQIEAVLEVRPIRRVFIWNRTRARADAMVQSIKELAQRTDRQLDVRVPSDLAAAVSESDVVVAATAAWEPVLLGEWVQPGTHVNLVGAHGATMREADDALLLKSDVKTVDAWDSASASGEIALPLHAGTVTRDQFVDIGAVALGDAPGRTDDGQITWFKSVGLAAQDLVCAAEILRLANRNGIGLEIDLSS